MIRSLFPGVRKAPSLSREQQDVQSHVNAVLQGLRGVPYLDGMLQTGVTLTTTSTAVAHPLGRAPKGTPLVLQSVTSAGVPQPVALADDPTKRTTATSNLVATAACVASLWWY